MSKRRFPPPWTIDEMNDACFIVRDKTGRRSAISISSRSRGDGRPRTLFEGCRTSGRP
jgi:hypothetical protein